MKFKKPYIIAEIGINHEGKFNKASNLIKLAKYGGADAVKFQVFNPNTIAYKKTAKSTQHKKTTKKSESNHEMWKRLRLNLNQLKKLKKISSFYKLDFICSVFDIESLEILKKLNCKFIKIASSELTDLYLLKKINSISKYNIISTGMANLNEIRRAVKIFGEKNICLLHCASLYPCDPSLVNMQRMQSLKKRFPKSVIGYSNHAIGIEAPILALSMGAECIEVHFTDNKRQIGADHLLSVDHHDLKIVSKFAKNIFKMKGTGSLNISRTEKQNRYFFRKSAYAKNEIKKGDKYSFENVIIRRPCKTNNLPKFYKLLGKKSKKNLKAGDNI